MYISPNKTIPINTIGISTTVKSILAIPHVALIPKKNSFPKTHSKHIRNSIVNIQSLPSYALMSNSAKLNNSPNVAPAGFGVNASITWPKAISHNFGSLRILSSVAVLLASHKGSCSFPTNSMPAYITAFLRDNGFVRFSFSPYSFCRLYQLCINGRSAASI